MHALGRHAKFRQRRLDAARHADGAADIGMVDRDPADDPPEQQAQLLPVQPSVQHIHVLLLLREHVKDRYAAHVAVLQVLQRAAKQDVRRGSAAVEQKELAVRLARENRLHDRQDRRDPGTGDEAHMHARLLRRQLHPEAACGHQDVNRLAGPQRLLRPRREQPAGRALDGDPQLPVINAGADRVGAPDLLVVQRRAERQILARPERIVRAQIGRDVERDGNRVGRLAAHLRDCQPVKARTGRRRGLGRREKGRVRSGPQWHLKWSKGSRQARQRQSDLQEVEPNAASCSVSAEPQRGQATS